MNSGSILVTGASGFVGRQIVRALEGIGYDVHGCGRVERRLAGVKKWYCADLRDWNVASGLISTVRPSHLIMAAWATDYGTYWSDPKNEDWRLASEVMARCFYEHGGSRAVFVGSCAEYDWSDPILARRPVSEHDAQGMPLTIYGRAKRQAAESIASIAETSGGGFAEARIFFAIGPGENSERLVPSVVKPILAGKSAKLDSPTLVRDFIDVRDAGAAIVKLLFGNVTGPVNIGTGAPTRLDKIGAYIGEITGRSDLIRIGASKPRTDEPPKLVADVTRLTNDVGYSFNYSLYETLTDSIDYWTQLKDGRQSDGSVIGGCY